MQWLSDNVTKTAITIICNSFSFQAVEGETNPRNLHLIFGIWPLVMAHFKLAEYSEDVFELFSCYFPIDFNPSKVGYMYRTPLIGGPQVV